MNYLDTLEDSIRDSNILLFENILEEIEYTQMDFTDLFYLLNYISKYIIQHGTLETYSSFISIIHKKLELLNRDLNDVISFDYVFIDIFDNNRYQFINYILSILQNYANQINADIDDIIEFDELLEYSVKSNNTNLVRWIIEMSTAYGFSSFINFHNYIDLAKDENRKTIENTITEFVRSRQ